MSEDLTTFEGQLEFLSRINAQVDAVPYTAVASDDSMNAWFDSPVPGHSFECRCYAVMKARLMREQGWDHEQMGLVLLNVEPPTREFHAVQYARTLGGIYIMDNRAIYPRSHIYRWDQPAYDYQWLYQQVHPSAPGTINWRDASSGLV